MGCWGVGPLDNDGALDWLQTVQDVGYVRRGLDSDDPDVVLAACGLVAWAAGWPMEEDPLECNRPEREKIAGMRRDAAHRCKALIDESSALYQLWAESEELEAWLAVVRSMIEKLRELSEEHAALRAKLTEPEQVEAFEAAVDGLQASTPKQRRLANEALRKLERSLG